MKRVLIISPHFPPLIWFSQTFCPGRGLEPLIQSLEILDVPVTLKLIGNFCIGYDAKNKIHLPIL